MIKGCFRERLSIYVFCFFALNLNRFALKASAGIKCDYDIIVIGGGAAGVFAAIEAASANRALRIALIEKTNRLLTKVKISGGGRCNVTHNCDYPSKLIENYPRGGKKLKSGFRSFGTLEMRSWLAQRGVELKTEADGRVFPVSDSSQTIIDCFLRELQSKNIDLKLRTEVKEIKQSDGLFTLHLRSGNSLHCQKVIVATGGNKRAAAYEWLSDLGLEVNTPVPSLFTFNIPSSPFKELMGLSVPHAFVQIPGTKWKQDGALLITHWGLSAPAVIKLSAWAAIELHQKSYQFPVLVNWCGSSEEDVRTAFSELIRAHPKKQIGSLSFADIPKRLWKLLLQLSEVEESILLSELPKKKRNKLIENLVRFPLEVNGKTTFKEEFVTCGGVALHELELNSFESKKIPGLYCVGEVVNVDGVTGGFNFQHAWTSGHLAGVAAAQSLSLPA